ncbi:MAG: hypothetical protein ACFFAE_09680 [Candidatus Hodarchaeota archaeon]
MKLEGGKQTELISLKLPLDFITDFNEYWESVKRIIRPGGKSSISWKKWKIISQDMLETLTLPFYDKWKHLERIKWIKAYIKSFSSITLQFKGASILLPKQLILYEAKRPNNLLLSNLKENPTNENLERVLLHLFEDLNIRLLKSDLQILQKLAQPGFSKSLDRYPKLKELAYGIRRDARTVSSRLDFLFQHQILSLIYLVDMARIGYQTILLFHKKERSDILNYIEPYIVMFFPLSPHDSFATIFQYPFNDIKSYKQIVEFFDKRVEVTMKGQYHGWNFSGLTKNPKDRWRLFPPILQDGGNWSKQLIIGDVGFEFNLDPCYDPYPLTYRQGQLLGIIHKMSTMEEDFLAKQLNIGRAYITADVKELLRNHLISRFPIFSNLGLGSCIHFCVRGLPIESGGLMNFLEHLKFFPYVNVFFDQNTGTLIGLVNIPQSWTNRFIFSLTSLPKTFPDCSSTYYIGPDSYAPWAFDILGTFKWNNHPH